MSASAIHQHIAAIAGKTSWENGVRALKEGAVLDVRKNGKIIEARVANVEGRFERVQVRFKKSVLQAQCTCNWKTTPFCEHAVASLLHFHPDIPHAEDLLGTMVKTTAAGSSAAETPHTATDSRRHSHGKAHSLRAILAQANATGHIEIHLNGGPPCLDSRWSRVEVRADLVFERRRYSASNIKRLVEIGAGAGGMRLTDFGLQEQQAMRFLLGHAEVVGTRYVLGAYDVADLFHCLANSQVIDCEQGRIHVHSEQIELTLVTVREGQYFSVTPRFALPAHGLLPAKDLKVIAGRGGSWIGVGADYWWMPGISDATWIRCFLEGETLTVTPADLSRLAQACETRRIPAHIAPDGETLELHATTGHCHPILTLDWKESGIVARLEFEYAGKRIDSDGPDILWERKRFVSRDTEAEEKAVATIKNMGFSHVPGKRDTFHLRDAPTLWAVLDDGFQNLGSDWQVYYSSRFTRNRNASGTADMTVHTARENRSWFELTLEVKTAAGELLSLEDVAEALRKQEQFIRLESGAIVNIPEKLRTSLHLLLDRAEATADDNRIRFGQFAAVPVSHAVREYCADGQAAWQTVCKRLETPVPFANLRVPESLAARLRGYQKEGVAWIAMLEDCGFHGILADEMGLGKTIQALAAIARPNPGNSSKRPSLVVCPTSLVENWLMEAGRFAPHLKATTIQGSDRTDALEKLAHVDLAITSYALLRRDVGHYREQQFHYLILDEAQHIKNPDTVNARTCKEIDARHRLILTGTPVENALHEVWSLFDFLLPGMLGTRRQFHRTYELPGANGEGAEAHAQLAGQIRPFILRRSKREVCSQLPPKVEQIVYCDLQGRQRQLYTDILAAGNHLLQRARNDGWNGTRFEILSLLMRLRQVCCDPALLPNELLPAGFEEIPSAKRELLEEIILQGIDSNSRMLLFSQFTTMLKTVCSWLDTQGIAYEYLDGATKRRQERVDRFNRDTSIPIFLISLKAGGTGLNLTGADTVIHYDQWWNPMVEDQATDRTHRIGQKKSVTSMKLVTRHTVEEKILELQEEKRALFNQLLGGAPANLNELRPQDFEFLLGEEMAGGTRREPM